MNNAKSLTGIWGRRWSGNTFVLAREACSHSDASSLTIEPSSEAGEFTLYLSPLGYSDQKHEGPCRHRVTLLEFLVRRFVPEYVASKRPAGRAHYHAMLKHIIHPREVDRIFCGPQQNSRTRLPELAEWPYLDAMLLEDIRPDHVHNLVSAAMKHGYSMQTIVHIRTVIRRIFDHAATVKCFDGSNPAVSISLPRLTHKLTPTLSLDQLHRVLESMRYPEREIALFGILTDMTVAEICGLQWKYINLSDARRSVDGEWQPPRTIAVTKQSYRGELQDVSRNRKRQLGISDVLSMVLEGLKHRRRSTLSDAFVFSSHNGTPINQDNLASRRLKAIGRRIDMPWLSWNVFHRTNIDLTYQYGRRLHSEIKKRLPLEAMMK